MNNVIKPAALTFLATLGLAAFGSPAKALVLCHGFVGTCAASNWFVSEVGDGSVNISPTVATLKSNDAGPIGSPTTVSMQTTASSIGTVAFNYDYLTNDVDGSAFDPFGYVLNGTFNQIVPPPIVGQGGTVTGSFAFNVSAGDTFGFYALATDSTLGSSITDVSSFKYTQVPGPLPILGAASAFGFSRRLRRKIKSHAA